MIAFAKSAQCQRELLWRHHRLCQRETQATIWFTIVIIQFKNEFISRKFLANIGRENCARVFSRSERKRRQRLLSPFIKLAHTGISQFIVCLTICLLRHEGNLVPVAFHIRRPLPSVASRIGVDDSYTRSNWSEKYTAITWNIFFKFPLYLVEILLDINFVYGNFNFDLILKLLN